MCPASAKDVRFRLSSGGVLSLSRRRALACLPWQTWRQTGARSAARFRPPGPPVLAPGGTS
eukprot:scaffold268_cov134-Isochrysis_galbana.AAC.18